jgi:hypothetical protein
LVNLSLIRQAAPSMSVRVIDIARIAEEISLGPCKDVSDLLVKAKDAEMQDVLAVAVKHAALAEEHLLSGPSVSVPMLLAIEAVATEPFARAVFLDKAASLLGVSVPALVAAVDRMGR